MADLSGTFVHGVLMAAGMAWKSGWSLVLGFAISATLQTVVSADRLRSALGDDGIRPVAIATAAGAASSSCSYASASIMRTMLKKGGALAPSLAFLIASTNLVLELGIILWLLLGWKFMLAEWIGGLVMIALMTAIVRIAIPTSLVEDSRAHKEEAGGHDHGSPTPMGDTVWDRLRSPDALPAISRAFVMEWRMLWKDLAIGFVVGGMLAAFVPDRVWQGLFLSHSPDNVRAIADVVIGPLVAMLTFVCSIGNVPLAAMLWGGGASFGGVIAFLYADLIVLPLIDTYRRYFGWRMAAAITGILFIALIGAALVMTFAFEWLGATPQPASGIRTSLSTFALDYSFWLNLLALVVSIAMVVIAHRNPAPAHGHDHDHDARHVHGHHG